MNGFPGAVWRRSTRSNDQGLCIEVADNLIDVVGLVGVRDSKDVAGPALAVSPPGWAAFVAAVRSGQFSG